jgi:cyclic pyranopterin phosphate synthase
MPEGVEWLPMEELLTYEEIVAICEEAVNIGITRFKITGGEPLVRRGCEDLIYRIKSLPKVEAVTLTTNGILLEEFLPKLKKAGLDGVNVSLDTLKPECFQKITGFERLEAVLGGLDLAVDMGLPVKINTVLQKDTNVAEWKALLELAKNKKIDVRFIELMPIGYGSPQKGISNEWLLQKIKNQYPNLEKDDKVHGNGPAVYYHIPGFLGSVGFISAIHGKFCDSCNRIRLTSTGELKPCLCYSSGLNLKKAVREKDRKELLRLLKEGILLKPQMHCFEEVAKVTEEKKMVEIGG